MDATANRAKTNDPGKPGSSENMVDRDLIGAFAVLWIASFVRIVGGVVIHETFGAEMTLALLIVLLLPVLLCKMLAKLILDDRARRHS